jgi:hypothetical protein
MTSLRGSNPDLASTEGIAVTNIPQDYDFVIVGGGSAGAIGVVR